MDRKWTLRALIDYLEDQVAQSGNENAPVELVIGPEHTGGGRITIKEFWPGDIFSIKD